MTRFSGAAEFTVTSKVTWIGVGLVWSGRTIFSRQESTALIYTWTLVMHLLRLSLSLPAVSSRAFVSSIIKLSQTLTGFTDQCIHSVTTGATCPARGSCRRGQCSPSQPERSGTGGFWAAKGSAGEAVWAESVSTQDRVCGVAQARAFWSGAAARACVAIAQVGPLHRRKVQGERDYLSHLLCAFY